VYALKVSSLFITTAWADIGVIAMIQSASCRKWWEAYWIVLAGPATAIGGGHRWKKAVLILTIVFSVSIPFFSFQNSIPFQGSLPPNAPLIKGYGRIAFDSEQHGVKSVSVARLALDNGPSFLVEGNFSTIPDVQRWEAMNSSQSLYFEGFNLRDGKGLFWITYAATKSGSVILSRQERKYH
jgi:hypothetical protein